MSPLAILALIGRLCKSVESGQFVSAHLHHVTSG
jgi:hypothetical protein